uniref:Uncharacterized protein n=1 Tax=Tanacetum cinerariifolium TaxID=118510 RepID=A0A699GT57_TANCI|nr:hypothetical protein [Tanacetum cinerariifolium]
MKCVTLDSVKPEVLTLGMYVIDVEPPPLAAVQIILWYLDSGYSKHMTSDRSRLRNFVKQFIETVRFGNDHFGAIMDYGDYVIGYSVISRVEDMLKSSPICLLSKAYKNKSWLWHRHLNHLNFDIINDLARKDLVRGLPRLKFEKDHLCASCQLGKSKKHTHQPKAKNTNLEVLNTLYMDICRPMRVQTINEKKYILVIVDDYSRLEILPTLWHDTFRSSIPPARPDATPFLIIIYRSFFPPRSTVERNCQKMDRTLMDAARTMLIFSKASVFLWAEAVATACYTQNRSLIHTRHNKTPYELAHDRRPDLTFL